MLAGFQQALLWVSVLGGGALCLAILVVTIRHRLLSTREGDGGGRLAPAVRRGQQPSRATTIQALLAETFWVLVPMVMVLGLGAWIVAAYLGHSW